jgi:hypothetical protein
MKTRLERWAGLARSPLCRPCDRLEARVGALLVLAFLLIAPLAAWLAGGAAYRASAHVEQAERSERVATQAVLLANAGQVGVRFAVVPQVPVAAQWTAPDGSPRTGQVVVAMSAPAGTAVPIWTDRAGNLVERPREHDQTVLRASVAAMVAVFGLAMLLTGVRAGVRRAVDRRRMAGWDAEWSELASRWT